jgi:hypothetical protein
MSRLGRLLRRVAGAVDRLDPDPWRMADWRAAPDGCFISGCDGGDIDQRGPIFLRDGSVQKACVEHWEPIMRVLGEQALWEHRDAMRSGPDQ